MQAAGNVFLDTVHVFFQVRRIAAALSWRALFVLFLGSLMSGDCRLHDLRPTVAELQIKYFYKALESYHQDTGQYPTENEGLEALRTNRAGIQGWKGPYLQRDITPDPWGIPYEYRLVKRHPFITAPMAQSSRPE